MTKKDFIAAIADRTGVTKKDAAAFVNAYHAIVTETLAKKEKITIVGFGGYSADHVAKRTGNNPQTGEKITIPAHYRPKFKAGKALKDALNSKKTKTVKKAASPKSKAKK